LSDFLVGPSSDLSGFGCILYTLFVGVPPFHADSNVQVFDKILKLDYTVPDFVPLQARDLIERLLRIKPEERIGHGEYDRDYVSIREHPFYVFIDWSAIATHKMPPWEAFAPAVAQRPAQAKPQLVQALRPTAPRPPPHAAAPTVVLEGTITKKGQYIGAKKRTLILTSEPRLYYCELGSKEMKREIPVREDTIVTVQRGKRWMIEIPGKTYSLTAEDTKADDWKAAIEKEIAALPLTQSPI
jgi:3-phosphoinositide dependent protein kinase-1